MTKLNIFLVFLIISVTVTFAKKEESKETEKQGEEKKMKKINLATKEIKDADEKEDDKDKKDDPTMNKYANEAHLRPTKCHVCRVLMQELVDDVNKTSNVKESLWLTNRLDGEDDQDAKHGKKIDYKRSELRIYDILEGVCKKVYKYRSIAGPDFPYLKGVKSMFRQNLEEMMESNGLSLKLDAPEEMVEDPTFEIKRMMFQCNQMVEEFEDDIIEWYMKAQEKDPIDFLCAERILDAKDHSCLRASTEVPEGAKKPSPRGEGDKEYTFHKGPKMEL